MSTLSYRWPLSLILCSICLSVFFPSLIPHVFWDCYLPRRHCCLVGAGKLAEDTSFLCLYIHAWLFSVVALPHCTVHSELDRLSLARQWSRQIITFFSYRWPRRLLTVPVIDIYSLEGGEQKHRLGFVQKRDVQFLYIQVSDHYSLGRKDKDKSVTYAPCTLAQSKRPLNQSPPSRLGVQRSWSCLKIHNWKACQVSFTKVLTLLVGAINVACLVLQVLWQRPIYVFIRIKEMTMIKEDGGQRNAETSF